MADLSGEPQPLSFAIEGADKQHVAASVTAENADCDAKGSIATGADGATIDKDDIIHELMTQLQANTDRLATLEANIKTINGAVGLPENPVVHPEPVDAEGDHLHASRGPDEVETADSDTDDEDVEDDGDSEEDNAKRTAKITARRMKYLPSEEWIPNKISETYKIDDFLPSSLSVVVSLEAKVSMTHHVIHSTLPEADCGSKPETGRSRPDRLAIPCATLLSEIAKISGTIISTRTNVFVRPFKNVIPFREEYHESLIQSKEAYNKLKKLKKEKEASYAEACKVADKLGEATPSKEEFHLSMADQSSLATARKLYLGLTCLLHFLDNDNAEIMYLRRQVKTRDFEISFEDLWHIFEPGQLVCPKGDKDQAYRVLNVGGGRPHRDMPDHDGSLQTKSKTQKVTDFFVDCFNTDFNGTHYVPTPLTMYIPPYDGTRLIKSLAVRPLEYLYSGEEEKDVRKKLVDRGKKFVRLAAVSHQRYSGLSLQDRDLRCEEVDGDVIIDFALAFKNNRVSLEERLMDPYISFQPPRSDISITDYYTPQSIEETREQCSASCSIPGCTMCPATVSYFYDDASFEFVRRTRFLEVSAALLKDIEQDLGDDRHLLLPYRMYGYVLLSRKWYPLDIDLLQDIDESHNESDGFKDLVLPEDHKQIVRALVKTHARGPRSASGEKDIPARQMDLVKGKGKGLIILLHGVPGVGKTSTAECVAAHTNRPLFPITCGDIGGQTPREVETNLESYFDLARKWGCVLLLDEADVFLGERTKGDILQNSLVSVFLRVLEYYSGVLILTTNRVGQFDEAIKSRIHISLYYPPLNKERTMRIWKMNLERLEREYGANSVLQNAGKPVRKATLPHVEFERHEIMDFAEGHWETCTPNKSHWNGRQIKNAFQTAIALAEWDAMDIQRKHKLKETIPIVLQKHHFKKVADASARFDEYLVAVRKTDSYNAKVKSNRLDEFNDKGTSSMYGMTYASYEERQQQRRNVRRTPVDADMREFDDQDDDLRVKKASGPMETRRYLPEDRTRKEPIQLGTVSDRGDRRNEQYVLADRFNGGRGPAYDDDGV